MRTRNSLLVGLCAMAMVFAPYQIASAQTNPFHNNPFHSGNPFHGHSSKNGPNVVGALCADETGNSVVYTKGGLRITAANLSENSSNFAGWEVFNSHPGVNPGNITPTPSSMAPMGTYTFTASGLPSGVELEVVSLSSNGSTSGFSNHFPVQNGNNSLVAPTVSGTLAAVYFWIFPEEPIPMGTYFVKDFKVNGKPLGIDTTHLDDNGATGDSWCAKF